MAQIPEPGLRQALGKRTVPRVVFFSPRKGILDGRKPAQRLQTNFAAAQSSGLTSSVQLGPTDERPSSSSQDRASSSSLEEINLESQAGEDYSLLREHLQSQQYQKADDETRALLIRLAGPDAVKRGWVYFTEIADEINASTLKVLHDNATGLFSSTTVKFIPEADLQIMDSLWAAASGGKFGYSAQKELWLKMSQRWDKFFQQIDWVQGENNNYRKWPKEFFYSTDAARGHLPLTNCLRGTQLFKAIMEHPAFVKADTSGNGSGNPSWLD